jgi:hypothetical protein
VARGIETQSGLLHEHRQAPVQPHLPILNHTLAICSAYLHHSWPRKRQGEDLGHDLEKLH